MPWIEGKRFLRRVRRQEEQADDKRRRELYLRTLEAQAKELLKAVPASESENYFRWLKSRFKIKRIYYPGCGDDDILEFAFDPSGIVYLDKDTKLKPRGRNLVFGDVNAGKPAGSPFRDSSFDAIFVQDLHIQSHDVVDFFRILKPKGLIIFSASDCGKYNDDEVRLPELRANSNFTEVKVPLPHRNFSTFQKVQSRANGRNH